MSGKEFAKQMDIIREYYRNGLLPYLPIWKEYLEPMSDERIQQVVAFYLLTHNEIPNSPKDLMDTHHLLELAEQVLNGEVKE